MSKTQQSGQDEKILPPNSHFPLFEEKDPSKLLVELDKGLRSPNVGDQCESIIFFAKLIARYPFPIIVNTTLLKLSELFRNGNNIVRYCIGKVFQEQGKVYSIKFTQNNGEESTQRLLLQRLLQPLYSNDPIARSLTLRTLGAMSDFLAEDLSMQHNIRNCLSSNHPQEVESAIYAIDHVCAKSAIFARSLLPTLSLMIRGLNCKSTIKLKLIEVLRHMKYDIEMVKEAKEILNFALDHFPSQSIVIVSLHTLSVITQDSLFDIPQHIRLLFRYLKEDDRLKVKLRALRDIKMIIHNAVFHFPFELISLDVFESFLTNQTPFPLRKQSLLFYLTLSKFFLSPHLNKNTANNNNFINDDKIKIKEENKINNNNDINNINNIHYNINENEEKREEIIKRITKECQIYLFDENILISQLCATILSYFNLSSQSIILSLCTILSSELLSPSSPSSSLPSSSPSHLLNEKTKLIKLFVPLTNKFKEGQQIAIDYLFSILPKVNQNFQLIILKVICKIVENSSNSLQLIDHHLPFLISFLLKQNLSDDPSSSSSHLLVVGSSVIFNGYERIWTNKRSASLFQSYLPIQKQILELTNYLLREKKNWELFLIAKNASTHSFHDISSILFQEISSQVESQHFYFYLTSLSKISSAENSLFSSSLFHSLFLLNDAISSLRAGKLKNYELQFQEQFLLLRQQFLQSTMNLLAEYPIILASNSSNGMIEVFDKLAQQFHYLRHSYFDIDQKSFTIIEALQTYCSLISFASNSLLLLSSAVPDLILVQLLFDKSKKSLFEISAKIFQKLQEIQISPLTFHQKSELFSQIINKILKISIPYPPYFYQTKPTSTIQLTIYPQPPSPGKPISTTANMGLVLTISGILQNSEFKKNKNRKVAQIMLEVTTKKGYLDAINNQTNYEKKINELASENSIGYLELVTTPNNESFTTTCILKFPDAGKFTLVVQCIIIDNQNVRWYARKNTFVHINVN